MLSRLYPRGSNSAVKRVTEKGQLAIGYALARTQEGSLTGDVLVEFALFTLVLHEEAWATGELVTAAIRLRLLGGCPRSGAPVWSAILPAARDVLPLRRGTVDTDSRCAALHKRVVGALEALLVLGCVST